MDKYFGGEAFTYAEMIQGLRQGVREIFFPCLPREGRDTSVRGYNCPVVSGYPEVIRLNTDEVRELGAHLYTPFVSLEHLDTLADRLHEVLGLPKLELWEAAHAARAEQEPIVPNCGPRANASWPRWNVNGGWASCCAAVPTMRTLPCITACRIT